ncbi:efflux ABC transporter, permease protein [Treponema phagedenis F0421]|nr:efflux ABC transporter, permease protein [Treponema phagedenis F0421]
MASFFIYLIYNVFEVWSNKRIKQIGMLKSIGVSKLQVFESIMLESIYIGALPILCGSLIGLIFNTMLFASINKYSTTDGVYFPQYHFGVIPFIAVIVFSFITVLIASLIPARRLSKMNIIDSLKGNIEKTKSLKRGF